MNKGSWHITNNFEWKLRKTDKKSAIDPTFSLKPLQPHWPHQPLQTDLTSLYSPISSKNFLILMVESNLYQNDQYWSLFVEWIIKNLIFHWYLIPVSIRGCWSQPMLLFFKLVDETQMTKALKHTKHHKSTKLLILLPLREIYFRLFLYETPCMYFYIRLKSTFWQDTVDIFTI